MAESSGASARAAADVTPSGRTPPPPLTPETAAAVPTWRAAYSGRTSALMATFAQLAYMPFEESDPAPRTPKAETASGRDALKAILAAGEFELVEIFNRDDTQAYLAVRPDQFAVLAFRGTTNFRDWITNLHVGRVPLPGRPEIKVHRGFLSAFQCCRAEIVAAVDRAVPPTLGLYITGHSLGGALAQIASAVLERDNLAACYTYGSPRVGTAAFDSQVKCPHYRLVNNWDIVPGIPLGSPWGYRHGGDPRLLKPTNRLLRRDRNGVVQVFVDIRAFATGVVFKRLLVVDDHMIWNYRRQLDAIAGPPKPEAGQTPAATG